MMADSSDEETTANEIECKDEEMEEKNEESAESVENVETVRKRGRPSNPNKTIKLPSIRGRGRPRKDGVPIPPEEPRVHNVGKRGRGRPMKRAKSKILAKIKATGLGRGRPPTKSSFLADIDRSLKPKVSEVGKKKGNRGRPRKQSNTNGNENESEAEESNRPGRPSTGGEKLQIIATGRGQGRPKKQPGKSRGRPRNQTETVSQTTLRENSISKRRGRPTLDSTVLASGGFKQRGRPKKVTTPVDLPE